MKVDPPTAKNTQSRRQETLVLVIDKDGRIFLGKREVALRTLAETIRDEMMKRQQQSVVIRADKASQHGVFVSVLDKCKEAKAKSVFVGALKLKD